MTSDSTRSAQSVASSEPRQASLVRRRSSRSCFRRSSRGGISCCAGRLFDRRAAGDLSSSVKIIQFAFPLVWVWVVLREPLRIGAAQRARAGVGRRVQRLWSSALAGCCSIVCCATRRHFTAAAPHDSRKDRRIRHRFASGNTPCWACFTRCSIRCWKSTTGDGLCFASCAELVPLWPAIVDFGARIHGASCDCAQRVLQGAAVAGLVVVGRRGGRWRLSGPGCTSAPARIFGTWLSHLLIDAGIFWVGYDLVRHALPVVCDRACVPGDAARVVNMCKVSMSSRHTMLC